MIFPFGAICGGSGSFLNFLSFRSFVFSIIIARMQISVRFCEKQKPPPAEQSAGGVIFILYSVAYTTMLNRQAHTAQWPWLRRLRYWPLPGSGRRLYIPARRSPWQRSSEQRRAWDSRCLRRQSSLPAPAQSSVAGQYPPMPHPCWHRERYTPIH